ncbi:MAG: SGNH/GDSL hydrolase family protein [Tannerellaceae bacterium]|nr:SGNH/GDSL hydrolase family protein [Tannerellaceae bacterium]
MRKPYLFILFSCVFLSAFGQWKWNNPLEAGFPVIQNQGWTEEIGYSYVRLPDRAKGSIREEVWELSRNAAGLAIHFYSNAPEIRVRYQVEGELQMLHMPATGVSGVDMYAINSDGEWNICTGTFSFNDTIRYHFSALTQDKYHAYGYEYRLYLPLYNTVKWLEIAVPQESSMEFIPVSPEKPLLLYGTSIAQGGCVSRAGMAWSTILQRSLGYPLINAGFSGNGRLEPEVLALIAETDARLYLLDCLPNLTLEDEEEVYQRILKVVKQIREKRSAPVLLIEHPGYSNMATHSDHAVWGEKVNRASRRAYEAIQQAGITGIYYLSREELAIPVDGWVDHIHLNELGMQAQAEAVEKKVREILCIPVGTTSVTRPVTQRREPHNYDWQKRHREMLAYNPAHPPRAVIIGNSITHFWGGEPVGPRSSGAESWEHYMRPHGFHNLGYGWDWIENVLWRVYHDELSGYAPERIVTMIGTNNMEWNTDQEIVEGLRFLLVAIRERQPEAEIQVVGILPRRDRESWVKNINRQIRDMTESEGYRFTDAGPVFLQEDGSLDESLFSDGLHPNEEGYLRLAPLFVE